MEFEEDTKAELTDNAITQSMYACCYPDGNQYLMLDSIIDFRHSTTDLCYSDQNFVRNGRTYRLISKYGYHL